MNGHAFDIPPPPPESVPPPPSDEPSSIPPAPPSSDRIDAPPPPPAKKKGWSSASKKQPLSVEELLQKKREADAAAAKPKFLSKADRERIALEKRQKEVEAAKIKVSLSRPEQNGTNGRVHSQSVPTHGRLSDGTNGTSRAPPSGPRALRGNEIPTGPASMRGREAGAMGPPTIKPSDKNGNKRAAPEETEAALVRQRYMGAEQNVSNFSAKKKRKRTTEKKFNFEWGTEEDTSQDYNPLYQNRTEAGLFGRGHRAGMVEDSDSAAQRYARSMELLDRENGGARAEAIRAMERQRRVDSDRNGLEKHWSEKRLDQMRERDWRIFKEDFSISTKGGSIPNPMRNWGESGLPKRLLDVVAKVGYDQPTPVQRAAIPVALQSRDLIGVAVTGSGKTAAFLLPLLVYISELPELDETNKHDGPYAIILAPTRELAQQIELEAKKFAVHFGFTCVSLVGGHSIEEQVYQLRDGAEIIIATPGRLVDCIDRRMIVLGQCCYIVMDEADRMIDLGFEEPVNRILDALPVSNEKPDTDDAENSQAMSRHLGGKDRYRQTMMYTATMPAAVERIARKYLRRPAQVTIGNVGEAVETVEQRVEFISGEDKRKKRLEELLTSGEFPAPVIVFVNIKRNCDAVARDIKHMGLSVVTLHGSKTQDQREAALAQLRRGEVSVLVATDLAGRGIDVPDVSLVVNFNMAMSIEAYTHRIGRTGRAGKEGVAITFLGNEDADVLYDLKQMLSKSSKSRVPEELRKHEAAQQKSTRGGGGGSRNTEESGGFGGRGGH